MKSMFALAKSFNQDVSNWNVENVREMGGFFYTTVSDDPLFFGMFE